MTHNAFRSGTDPATPARRAVDRAGQHRRREGQVHGRVRHDHAGGGPGLVGRRHPVHEVRQVAGRRGEDRPPARRRLVDASATASPGSPTTWTDSAPSPARPGRRPRRADLGPVRPAGLLDEITYPVNYGWIEAEPVWTRPSAGGAERTNVVCTGRDAPAELVDARRHGHRDAQGQARLRRPASGPSGGSTSSDGHPRDLLSDHGDRQVAARSRRPRGQRLGAAPDWLRATGGAVDLAATPTRPGSGGGRRPARRRRRTSACCSTARPRRSGCSPRRCGPGSRHVCTRRSPHRRRRCARPGCRCTGSSATRPTASPSTPPRFPRRRTWWCWAGRTTRPDATEPRRGARRPDQAGPGAGRGRGVRRLPARRRRACTPRGLPGLVVRAQPHQAVGARRAARGLPARRAGADRPACVRSANRGR